MAHLLYSLVFCYLKSNYGLALLALGFISLACLCIGRAGSFVQRLPLPDGHELIWGHERLVFMHEPGHAFRTWIAKLGPTFRIKAAFGAPDILVLSDPTGIAHILQRKIFDYLRSFVHESHDSLVLNDFATFVENTGSPSCELNILTWTAKATLNVVGRVAFLHDFEGGNSREAQDIITARRAGITPAARYAGFLSLMLLRRFPILNDLPIQAIQAQGTAKRTIQAGVAKEMIARNKSFVNPGEKREHRDLLSLLLIASLEDRLSADELSEQISTFIMTGHEATTMTLGFTVWELSRNQGIQDRLREELSDFTGEPTYNDFQSRLPYLDAVLKETLRNFTGEPTYNDFQSRLPYLDAVLKETLRKYPGLPYMERVATKHDIIPLGQPVKLSDRSVTSQVEVSPGQIVLIPIIAIQRLNSLWKDAEKFRPERWLEDLPSEVKQYPGWSNLLVFSDGPRSCVGSRLAMFQYKVILSGLVTRFRFGAVPGEVTLKIASSIQPWIKGHEARGPQLPVSIQLI
ncbi:cytochrome P450 [Sanghuangporus baumii]|uniref:Cytochrome P450 n=1 Tax=Sanghuangporus baumii TaxID=108892 RepID=A0A9Q5MZJ9_SANBA|nr:cytochrome P450 [Sanghuangporus baumii]